MKLCFPRNRYLASILLRLHKSNNPEAEHIFRKYHVSFHGTTIFIKPRTIKQAK